jgi:hypothetical protein
MGFRGLPQGGPVENRKGLSMTNTEPSRQSRRRKQAIAGAVGVAAILGGGAFLVTDAMTDEPGAAVRDATALAPVVPPTSPAPSAAEPSASPSTPARSGAVPSKSAPTSATPRQKSRAEMIEQMKGAAAKATDNVKRPLALPGGTAASAEDVTVTETGSLKTGGTLKVVSARRDLSGQGELSIVADEGTAVGEGRCTQNFRFSADAPAAEKPMLMICWRTSATKSVYTVAVAQSGRPSAEISTAAIARQWTKLG